MFQKAVKHAAKLRLAITGPSGAGKTYTALAIATAMSDKVAVVDTEHGSASKYADLFGFDVVNFDPPFHPDRFCKAIEEAASAGYGVVILDSLTHAWTGTGGLLEEVDKIAARSNSKNSFMAWKEGTPIYNRMVETIVQSKIHVIATMRSKTEYAMEVNERGKQTPVKKGMAAIQRDGFEYEFDVVLDMNIENAAIVSKSRCPQLSGEVIAKPGANVAKVLVSWLDGAPMPETKEQNKQVEKVVSNGKRPPTTAELRSAYGAKMQVAHELGLTADPLPETATDAEIIAAGKLLAAIIEQAKAEKAQ